MALTCPDVVYPSVVSLDGVRYTKFPNPYGDTSQITASLRAFGWGQEITAGGTITGPAPLAVFFDALGTTHGNASVDPFRNIGYHFDFGYATPTTPGSWTHSGDPKGNQIGGPLAAHVFQTAGTYSVTLRAQDANGNHSDKTVTVVVVDADTYWTSGGRSTVDVPGTTMPSSFASNTRYRFAKGTTYTGTAGNINALTNVAIAATGAGATPILTLLKIETTTTTPRSWSSNISICDVAVEVEMQMPCSYVLLHNVTTTTGLSIGTSVQSRYNNAANKVGWYMPRYLTISECTIPGGGDDYGIFCSGASRSALIGSTVHTTLQHNVRFSSFYGLFVGHNRAYGCGSTKANMTFRAAGTTVDADHWNAYAGGDTDSSRYLVCAANDIGSAADTSSNAAITVQPEAAGFSQGIQDALLLDNVNSRTGGGNISLECRRGVVGDNTVPSVGYDVVADGLTPQEWYGPYYTDVGANVDNVNIFAFTRVSPSKAGT